MVSDVVTRKQLKETEMTPQVLPERAPGGARKDPTRSEVISDAKTMSPQGFEDLKTSSKTEGTDRPLAAALWLIGLDGGADEELSGEDWYVVRVGRFIAIENVQGFISVEDYDSVEKAEKIIADLGSEEARAADAELDEELGA